MRPMPGTAPVGVAISPSKFASLVSLVRSVDEGTRNGLASFQKEAEGMLVGIHDRMESFSRVNGALAAHAFEVTRRNSRPILSMDDIDDLVSGPTGSANFLKVAYEVTANVMMAMEEIREAAASLVPGDLVLSKREYGDLNTAADLGEMLYEFQLNEPVISRFVIGLARLDVLHVPAWAASKAILKALDSYHHVLIHRHSVEGIEIHKDPVATDVAIVIYDNIDSHGEIDAGKKADQISAYTMEKAIMLAESLKIDVVDSFVNDPSSFIDFIISNLRSIWSHVDKLRALFEGISSKMPQELRTYSWKRRMVSKKDFDDVLHQIETLDPRRVEQRDKSVVMTASERYTLKFRNETLADLVWRLGKDSTRDIVSFILQRKAQLHAFFQDENSFYVCAMGDGNPFLGEAPGALKVIPGQRPVVDMKEIVGSGFDDVRRFVRTIEGAAKWHDLFVASSPSRTADKSNVLLVGPQGCGKSEVLRAVGADQKSIGIYAQGSDFLTCWKGEAEKNPKRLFEAAVKMRKESGRHVHILIDEIDAVLNTDQRFGATNLTLEFQMLMDGVVSYPGLSVWGATNHPERIPMPMIRRFSKVLIVGELTVSDRVKLLSHFLGFLPCDSIDDEFLSDVAQRLDGATGDVLRKVADHVWRNKMLEFTDQAPEKAEELVKFLNDKAKFDVAEFDSSRRSSFRQKLGQHVQVRRDDVEASVAAHLSNFAVLEEIRTARETYATAKQILSVLSGQG